MIIESLGNNKDTTAANLAAQAYMAQGKAIVAAIVTLDEYREQDHEHGRELFRNRKARTECMGDAERAGWDAAEQATYRQDFKDGYRKFWQQLPLSYCCNGGERAGFWAAAEEAHAETQRTREHAADVRQTMGN